MTSAQIAARQQVIAALEAEFQEWKGSTNAAIARLNAATAAGDTGLFGVAKAAIVVVNALNPYHQVLLKALADAAALVPDDPPPPTPPVLSFPVAGLDVLVGAAINLAPFSSKPGAWSMDPSEFVTLSADGKLTGTKTGTTDLTISVDG